MIAVILLAFVVIAAVVLVGYGIISNRLDNNRKDAVAYKGSWKSTTLTLNSAEGALRRIANTSADESSRLEAQIALDEIARSKEITT